MCYEDHDYKHARSSYITVQNARRDQMKDCTMLKLMLITYSLCSESKNAQNQCPTPPATQSLNPS
jgi:hypothetical protein